MKIQRMTDMILYRGTYLERPRGLYLERFLEDHIWKAFFRSIISGKNGRNISGTVPRGSYLLWSTISGLGRIVFQLLPVYVDVINLCIYNLM